MLTKLKRIYNSNDKVLLQCALDDATAIAKEYCHVKELPPELDGTILRMAADIYKNDYMLNQEGVGEVSSIKTGDTSTSFHKRDYSSGYADSILKNYKSRLNKYRKVRW